jgi:SAM-dependent methyltransferase
MVIDNLVGDKFNIYAKVVEQCKEANLDEVTIQKIQAIGEIFTDYYVHNFFENRTEQTEMVRSYTDTDTPIVNLTHDLDEAVTQLHDAFRAPGIPSITHPSGFDDAFTMTENETELLIGLIRGTITNERLESEYNIDLSTYETSVEDLAFNTEEFRDVGEVIFDNWFEHNKLGNPDRLRFAYSGGNIVELNDPNNNCGAPHINFANDVAGWYAYEAADTSRDEISINIADIGCGIGRTSESMIYQIVKRAREQRKEKVTINVTGIDFMGNMTSAYADFMEDIKGEYAQLDDIEIMINYGTVTKPMHDVILEQGSYDAVVYSFASHHEDEIEDLAQNTHNALKDGGYLINAEPDGRSLFNRRAFNWLDDAFAAFRTYDEARDEICGAGFEEVDAPVFDAIADGFKSNLQDSFRAYAGNKGNYMIVAQKPFPEPAEERPTDPSISTTNI